MSSANVSTMMQGYNNKNSKENSDGFGGYKNDKSLPRTEDSLALAKSEHQQAEPPTQRNPSPVLRLGFVAALAAFALLQYHYVWESSFCGTKTVAEQSQQQVLNAANEMEVLSTPKLTELLYLNDTHAFDMLMTIRGTSSKSNNEESSSSSSSAQDFYYYQQGWETQITQSYCAVASAAAVLNSLSGDTNITLPQDPEYDPFPWATQNQLMQNKCVKRKVYNIDKMDDIFWGFGLDLARQLLDCLLNHQNYIVTAHHVNPQTTNAEQVREIIKDSLLNPRARVVINYDRGGIGQGNIGHGHFSPIGAYHERMDAFLVMDVAKYKYPPVWVPAETLVMGGMGSLDDCGSFQYPMDGPPDMSQSWEEIDEELGCMPAHRGFLIIEPLSSTSYRR